MLRSSSVVCQTKSLLVEGSGKSSGGQEDDDNGVGLVRQD